jgi:hypothetical protein
MEEAERRDDPLLAFLGFYLPMEIRAYYWFARVTGRLYLSVTVAGLMVHG